MPVYNGARFLPETLDSWLLQDEKDFELIVSDNASTDETAAILAEYSARDARLRVRRRETNVIAWENYNGLVDEARAPYFAWAACDDLRDPAFLSSLADTLDARPDAVLAYPRSSYFGDPRREQRHPRDPDRPPGIEATPVARVSSIVRRSDGVLIYGLIRRDVLRRTRLFVCPMGFNADIGLAVELATLGPMIWIDRELMSFRLHDQSLGVNTSDPIYAGRRGRVFDPNARAFVEGLPVSPAERDLIRREVEIWCRKGRKPRHGLWKIGFFRSAYLRGARGLVDVSRLLRGL